MAKGGEFLLPAESFPNIFTSADLDSEQCLIRKTIRRFMVEEVLTDTAIERIESQDWEFTKELLRKLGGLGMLGIEVPEEYGGINLGAICSAIVAEEIAPQGSFACTFLAHTGIGTMPIRFFGTKEQKEMYLPGLTSGELIASYSLTETGAGSDAASVKTRAIQSEGEKYTLMGQKTFVTNGGIADVYTIFAQLEDAGLSAFIVPRIELFNGIGKEQHKMGIQGSSTVPLYLDNVRIPRDHLLGEPGKGFKIALNILNLGRFKLAAACLGGGRAAFSEAVDYAKTRKQFGKVIINFGAIRQKLVHMKALIYAMDTVVYRLAGCLEESIGAAKPDDSRSILKAVEEFAAECSIVKVFCSEALDRIVDENVQIHGGNGFCEGNPERHYRDSRINRIFEGTNEINRMVIVGMILKKALSGQLPFIEEAKRVFDEALTPSLESEPDNDFDRLVYYLNNAKKAVLLASGAAWKKHGVALEQHQAVLMNLADCITSIYILESIVAALNKKSENGGQVYLAQWMCQELLFQIERSVKELVAMCTDGDAQRTLNAMMRRFLKFTVMNKEELAEKIMTDS